MSYPSATSGSSLSVSGLYTNILNQIIYPAEAVIFSVALIVFLWGVYGFIREADNEESRSTGRQHMIWGIVGMAIMVGAYGLVQVIKNTIGQ
jgi:uncharacterized membrane protein YiaA